MLSGAYFGVISPEGAASILGRYDNDAHKAKQFPLDCQELAKAQNIYANQLQELGTIPPCHNRGCLNAHWSRDIPYLAPIHLLSNLAAMAAQAQSTALTAVPSWRCRAGIVDSIIYEKVGETFEHCPHLCASIRAFVSRALNDLSALDADALIQQRFDKFRYTTCLATRPSVTLKTSDRRLADAP
jgi:acetyl-CoA carboxylase alpha subunit